MNLTELKYELIKRSFNVSFIDFDGGYVEFGFSIQREGPNYIVKYCERGSQNIVFSSESENSVSAFFLSRVEGEDFFKCK